MLVLREYMKKKNLSNYDICKMLGVKPSTVSSWVNGARKINHTNALRLVRATKGELNLYDLMRSDNMDAELLAYKKIYDRIKSVCNEYVERTGYSLNMSLFRLDELEQRIDELTKVISKRNENEEAAIFEEAIENGTL